MWSESAGAAKQPKDLAGELIAAIERLAWTLSRALTEDVSDDAGREVADELVSPHKPLTAPRLAAVLWNP